MPMVYIHVTKGHSDEYLDNLQEGAHRAMVDAFAVPERDRYQIVSEHSPRRMIIQDTGLDIPRTGEVTLFQVVSRPRSESAKTRFYELLCKELSERCGIAPSDIMVSIVVNSDADWSFGFGRAQFLTGEL